MGTLNLGNRSDNIFELAGHIRKLKIISYNRRDMTLFDIHLICYDKIYSSFNLIITSDKIK